MKMNTFVVMLLLALWLNAVNTQLTVTDVQVVGGDDRSGYIQVTIRYRDGTTATGPVCGTIDRATASYACRQKGFLSTIAWGTVNSIGNFSQPTSTPVGSNLDCMRHSNGRRYTGNGRYETSYVTICTISSTAGCSPGNLAALVCGGWTTSALTGIIVSSTLLVFLLLFILVVTLLNIQIYKRNKRRAARSGMLEHPSKAAVDDPTFGQVDKFS